MILANLVYLTKTLLGPVRRLVPRSWRKKLFLLIANQAIAQLPSRKFLETSLLANLPAQPALRMLCVGTQSYNRPLYRACEALEIKVWSIDLDPNSSRWPAPQGHFVGDVCDIPTLAGELRFDVILFNGVLGFGINSYDAAQKVCDALRRVSASSALLLVGWNPGLTDDSEILAFRAKLEAVAPGNLPSSLEFPSHGKIQPHAHRYEFFRLASPPNDQ